MTTSSPKNDLVDFMRDETARMQHEYERISARASDDPGTAGDEGEENWAKLLRDWLPATYRVATKGRLLNEKGIASPQVDVVVLQPSYPTGLLSSNKKMFLTAGVAAAFECKTTLRAAHIEEACANAAAIHRLIDRSQGSAKTELHSPLIYGLLAHSHSWKGANSDPHGNIERALFAGDLRNAAHPAECLDLLCVSDLVLWTSHRAATILTHADHSSRTLQRGYGVRSAYGKAWPGMFVEGSEPHARATPIGGLVSRLLEKLARQDATLRGMARYFQLSGIWGGETLHERVWPDDTLSAAARQNLVKDGYFEKNWPYE